MTETIVGPGTSEGAPAHLLMNAENSVALRELAASRTGEVDLIYIDPPYNTGNRSWTYNDKRDGWIDFMEERLRLAKPLLAPTGVIIVAIGDDEHHRLRMLMDDVFGAANFISNVVWQGGRKNDSRYVSNSADYMLVYARDQTALSDSGAKWRERKPGVELAFEAASRAWLESDQDSVLATKRYRIWLYANRLLVGPGVSRFKTLDGEGRPYNADRDLSWPGGGGPKYPVIHPTTGKTCAVPSRGWIYSRPERMQEMIDDGRVQFGEDESKIPRMKSFLDEVDSQVPESVFYKDRRSGAKHLASVLGDKRFPFPKDHEVLARWIGLTTGHRKNAVVLDFFGGSGSTLEAVLRMNAADSGDRRCILVTNNELAAADAAQLRKAGHAPGDDAWEVLGVYHHVTVPRIRTVLTGIREDGSVYSDGLPGRVELASL